MKSPKTREKLIQAVQLSADATLRHCAILNNDARILAIASRDIVAAEAHYHASCYKSYTNIKTKEGDHVGDQEVETNSRVIPNKEVVPVVQLTEKLEAFMSSKGEALKTTSKKNIRRRLESELGNSIHIFSNDSGKLLLVPDSLLFKDAVLDNENLCKELAI